MCRNIHEWEYFGVSIVILYLTLTELLFRNAFFSKADPSLGPGKFMNRLNASLQNYSPSTKSQLNQYPMKKTGAFYSRKFAQDETLEKKAANVLGCGC